MDVVLFCGQEGNFQTRCMFVPVSLLEKNEDLCSHFNLLREHSTFDKELDGYLMYLKLEIQNQLGTEQYSVDRYKHYIAADILTMLADGCFAAKYQNEIISLPDNGFEHRKNFIGGLQIRDFKGTHIHVVEGFLVLEDMVNEVEPRNIPHYASAREFDRPSDLLGRFRSRKTLLLDRSAFCGEI